MRNYYKLCLGFPIALIASCVSPNQEIITSSLRDNLISVARDAKEAGATQVKYTAHVVDATDGSASVVVPSTPPLSFGGGRSREAGTKVEITIDIPKAAAKQPSGERFLLNPQTMRTQTLPITE
jgi:hypothetical protein